MKTDYNIPTGPRSDAIDATAKKQVMPPMTQAVPGKVLGSSNVAGAIDRYDPGPPKQGVGITSMRPIKPNGGFRGY